MMYEAKNHDAQFEHHEPVSDQASRYNMLRGKAKEFATLIDMCCPESREKSLAMDRHYDRPIRPQSGAGAARYADLLPSDARPQEHR